jgi:hypothetical protein
MGQLPEDFQVGDEIADASPPGYDDLVSLRFEADLHGRDERWDGTTRRPGVTSAVPRSRALH